MIRSKQREKEKTVVDQTTHCPKVCTATSRNSRQLGEHHLALTASIHNTASTCMYGGLVLALPISSTSISTLPLLQRSLHTSAEHPMATPPILPTGSFRSCVMFDDLTLYAFVEGCRTLSSCVAVKRNFSSSKRWTVVTTRSRSVASAHVDCGECQNVKCRGETTNKVNARLAPYSQAVHPTF